MRSVSSRRTHCELPAAGAEPRRSPRATGFASAGRAGATLTEVLMAILIMAVGVVSVFTLFPITVLRTIQATNQTNAKILKQNVDEQIAQSPEFLTAFSASTNAAPASPLAGFTMQGEWQPGIAYAANNVVTPTIKAGGAVPRPFAFFVVATAGTSGLVEPVWNAQAASITDNGVTWQPLNFSRYVIDPLGWNLTNGDGQTARVVDTFGNKTDKSTGVPTGFAASQLIRINGSLNTTLKATDYCTHPDSWQQLFQATPTTVTATSASFPGTVDLSGVAGTTLVAPRVVLTSLDGKQSVARRLTSVAAPNVDWSSAEQLPDSFQRPPGSGNFEVGTARFEIFNRRYAWFLTVRNVGARPEIKCVVTFNRSGAPAEEHAYDANFGNALVDLDADGFADGDINQDGTVNAADGTWSQTGQIVLRWTAAEPEPLLKAGNWLFDGIDASWYRIQSIDSQTATTARLTLDRPVRAVTTDDGSGPPPNADPMGRAILMPGIVEVFDL